MELHTIYNKLLSTWKIPISFGNYRCVAAISLFNWGNYCCNRVIYPSLAPRHLSIISRWRCIFISKFTINTEGSIRYNCINVNVSDEQASSQSKILLYSLIWFHLLILETLTLSQCYTYARHPDDIHWKLGTFRECEFNNGVFKGNINGLISILQNMAYKYYVITYPACRWR